MDHRSVEIGYRSVLEVNFRDGIRSVLRVSKKITTSYVLLIYYLCDDETLCLFRVKSGDVLVSEPWLSEKKHEDR